MSIKKIGIRVYKYKNPTSVAAAHAERNFSEVFREAKSNWTVEAYSFVSFDYKGVTTVINRDTTEETAYKLHVLMKSAQRQNILVKEYEDALDELKNAEKNLEQAKRDLELYINGE